ncbi:MAG: ABC transporter permease subunit, partial [Vulcanimicrobiaceae bacterium]
LEAAALFAIFTSQVWNMTFSFYQSLRTLPQDLVEAAAAYGLSPWERFVRLEMPAGAIGLIWNAMMSFGGGWFFLAASEAISVLNHNYTLPGIGSYVAGAVTARDMPALGWAVLTMAITIVLIDQLFWRPLVAWADKFRLEQSASADSPRSWVYDLLRRSRVPDLVERLTQPIGDPLSRGLAVLTRVRPRAGAPRSGDSPIADRIFDTVALIVVLGLVIWKGHDILPAVGLPEVWHVLLLGLATFGRVVILLVFATLIWTPIGVAIGLSPTLTRCAQPIAMFLASFPANFIFPFATLAFITLHVPINFGCILLMALGAQWYILFNTIAGAASIPTELREMAADVGLHGWQRWRRLIIPAIFSSWVTGGITASGGAWNASIVSEVVSWGTTTLSAAGLGAYIADATTKGDWPRITLGVSVMSLYVVGINRVFWRRLYKLAETRYHL